MKDKSQQRTKVLYLIAMTKTKDSVVNRFVTLDDVEAIILVADAEGDIVYANRAVKTILGFEQSEMLGNGWWECTSAGPDEIQKRRQIIGGMARGEVSLAIRDLYENPIRGRSGRIVWTQWTNSRTEDGFLIGVAQDITSKKELEQKLIQKNIQNELLLREIHHRVKNNLQVISSLLNLQFDNICDPAALDALSKSKDRIHAMGLLHTTLYESADFDSINFREYLPQLIRFIATSYNFDKRIEWSSECQVEQLNIDISMNLGLIITELVTNSFKHAFGNGNGLVKVILNQNADQQYVLSVEDNGVGIPEDLLKSNDQTFGFSIVRSLVGQINGIIDIDSRPGCTRVLVSFSK